MTRKSLVSFLTEEQHKVRPEMVSKLLEEFGDGYTLTRPQLKELMRQQQLTQQQQAARQAAQNL